MRGEIVGRRTPPYSRTVALALVAVFVFLIPVQTYSGAEQPHSHAMFQLVAEALHLIPPHGHSGAHHRGSHDPAGSDQVVYRSDHPLNTSFGDQERTPSSVADPPVLTKVSLAYATYAPVLVPQTLLADRMLEQTVLEFGSSDNIPTGQEIAPDPPPPRNASILHFPDR